MAPKALAILIGAGPAAGAGIARILAHPSHGNYAVALLARNADNLSALAQSLRSSAPGSTIESFPTDTAPANLAKAFENIKAHSSFKGLKLRVTIYSIKNASVKPFEEETFDQYMDSMQVFAGGAMAFAQESLKLLFEHHGRQPLSEGGSHKGAIIFTGTLGALRTNPKFASYGGSRAAVRSLAQAVAKEYSPLGVHGAHVVANGAIKDEDNEGTQQGKSMSSDAVGKTYLWLAEQQPTLYTHELDIRPAQEKF
ncbi:uncharacterized protein KY384_007450 [Bacidia gigantensis]|uniref:uncharacterized protein n=1 Tax=Bacidia gigantensis TaxID=2732470 RepID=UPI001D05054B|nr:uncharacterized protein KY384_007450 [Bacidia gigantensis]KAG8528532.1 hypothetical protein KY384_007450 [Bacidia gigantensis]